MVNSILFKLYFQKSMQLLFEAEGNVSCIYLTPEASQYRVLRFDGKDRPFIIYTKDKNNQYTRDEIQET